MTVNDAPSLFAFWSKWGYNAGDQTLEENRVKKNDKPPKGEPLDRLTRVLIGVALVLAVLVAILGIGLLRSDGEPDDALAALATDPAGAIVIPTVPTLPVTPTPPPITPPPCTPPPDWQVHVVQPGDTLFELAQTYGSGVAALQQVNCLSGSTIRVGQDLYVPDPTYHPALPAVEPTSADPAHTTSANRYLNIALLGSDKRPDAATWRTDTIIVVSLDMERNLVRLLSIPRDLWVNIPGHGPDRINTADLWGEMAHEGGGPDLVKQTIYQNLGIPIHYWVRVDFDGFKRIIDAVGGVDVDVECPLPDIELETGMQHMDGELALWYARSRMTTNDFDRGRRQRKLLMALWDQALSPSIIPQIPSLLATMNDAIQTDLPPDQIIALAFLGLKLKPNQIFSQSIGPWQVQNWTTPGGAAVLLPLHDKIKELLDSFYGPIDLDFLEQVSQTAVAVQNGTSRPEAGQLAATSLHWAGFQARESGPAPAPVAVSQVIVYNAEQDVAELVAITLDLMPSALSYQPDPDSATDILVVLGEDYDPCRR